VKGLFTLEEVKVSLLNDILPQALTIS